MLLSKIKLVKMVLGYIYFIYFTIIKSKDNLVDLTLKKKKTDIGPAANLTPSIDWPSKFMLKICKSNVDL